MPAVSASPAAGAKEDDEHVTVHLADSAGDMLLVAQAKRLASQMFAGIEVKIVWRVGLPAAGQKGVIGIEIVTNTPESLHPSALAYSRPYEGVHIRIFWDRIQRMPFPNKVLAHVMVHEITHILEGIDRHSGEGIMKAHWSDADFGSMGIKPLSFAPEDVLMIHNGLKTRNSSAQSTTGQPERTSVTVSGAGK